MKLLTFLGTGKYSETTYVYGEKSFAAKFAPAASCHFLGPQSVVVFLTEKAEQEVYPEFRKALPASLSIQPVAVPLGANDAELWQVFGQVSGSVAPGEEVAFDITHGLRSSPLIGLLAAAFLRAGLGIQLKAVMYGAYDVGQQVSPGRTPMFDLTPMLALLEWAQAADRFNQTGDARALAKLLEGQKRSLALGAAGDRGLLDEAGALGSLAASLQSVSQALRLIRPYQAMEQVAGLPAGIERARPALERSAPAHPFELLLDAVSQSYAPLAQAAPRDVANVHAMLGVQRAMIRWYAERELWVQAVSLAREWVVSYMMLQMGLADFTDKESRDTVEQVLGAESRNLIGARKKHRPFMSLFLSRVSNAEQILDLWMPLADRRNDTLHAGMRPDPGNPSDLIRDISKHIATIQALPL